MRTIGLIGGMSWESTVPYYRIINEEIRNRLGGLHSAKILLYSVDFDEIERYQSNNEWENAGDVLGRAARKLESAGADFIVICTNTMHKAYSQIASMVKIPVIHIADATADELERCNVRRVGLLGTKYTMTQDFYKDRLTGKGLEILIPDREHIDIVNSIIFDELCVGEFKEGSRIRCLRVIDELRERGAEAIILGCTELGMLVDQADTDIPLFDTTVIHAEKAAELALADG